MYFILLEDTRSLWFVMLREESFSVYVLKVDYVQYTADINIIILERDKRERERESSSSDACLPSLCRNNNDKKAHTNLYTGKAMLYQA